MACAHTTGLAVPSSDATKAPIGWLRLRARIRTHLAAAPPLRLVLDRVLQRSFEELRPWHRDSSDPTETSARALPAVLVSACSAGLLAAGLLVNASTAHAAPSPVTVSLTFDDGTISQYSLGWQRALAPHGMNATYFVPTGKIGSGSGFMTWGQLSSMFTAGNEIGGHTSDHVNLTGSTLTYDQKLHQVCDDRQALLQHSLDGVSFAYPEGAYDQTAEDIVRTCGYSSGRAAGGVSANGPVYGETIPPPDAYATRTWTAPTPSTSPIQLSDMQAVVKAAAEHGAGWVQIVIHRVCSQTYDPANYSGCLNSWRPIELDTLNQFLDWMAAAGQTAGAPTGSIVRTVRQAIGPARTSAPTTTVSCNGTACSTAWYRAAVHVALTATSGPDGSPVTATYYTTDGSTPTPSSQEYTGPIELSASTTLKFFSVDQAGHNEAVKSQLISVDGASPTVSIAQPASGSNFKRGTKVAIVAAASDLGTGSGTPSGVARVDLFLNESTRLTSDTASPYQYSWNTAKLRRGTYSLTAVAIDVAGNSTASAPITVTIS